MSMSVSVKKATNKTSINHNNRTMSDKEKERNSHIDYSRSHENKYLVQEDIKKLYEREFGGALEEYNAKQKRSDRKIDDYYKHIQASKKTATQQEMIIQIGDKDDFSSNENRELANEIIQDWYKGFEERNPNLKVYNAVIHNDEASPHMHLNFVPVADGYKRGLERQVAFDRAIKQQDNTLDKVRPFEDWREKEVQLLEKMLLERGIERKLVGTNEYKDVNEYKEKKDQLREIEKQIDVKKNELLALNEEVLDEIKVTAKKQYKSVEEPTGEKTIFGKEKTETKRKETGNVILSEDDFEKMMTAAKQNKKIKGALKNYLSADLVQENQKLKDHIKKMQDYNKDSRRIIEKLKKEYTKQFWENDDLKDQISDLKHEVQSIYQSTKEILKERTNDFKGVLKDLISKVKEKVPGGEFERSYKQENTFSMENVKDMDSSLEKSSKRNRDHDLER